jgi:cytochrome c oxidase assembly factor CtaG
LLLFWCPVVGVWPSRPVWPRWTVIPYLVSADLINTAQSAILTFSSRLLYPSYAHAIRPEGFSALDDQMLAGVIMWVPGSIAFLLPAIMLTLQLVENGGSRRSASGGHDDMHTLVVPDSQRIPGDARPAAERDPGGAALACVRASG